MAVRVSAETAPLDLFAARQEQVEALERDQAWLTSCLELGHDVNSSLLNPQSVAEDKNRFRELPAKVEQTLTGALRLGQELQQLRRAHITLQEAHMKLRSEHSALQERIAKPCTPPTKDRFLAPRGMWDGSAPCGDDQLGDAKQRLQRLKTADAKDFQLRGMLQKLTDVACESPAKPNVSHNSVECLKIAPSTPLWASPTTKQRRSQSVASLKEYKPLGSAMGNNAYMSGAGAHIPTAPPNGNLFGRADGNFVGSTCHLSSAGRLAVAPTATPGVRPGTSERAAVRDALSELLSGMGTAQRRQEGRDQLLGPRCRSN